MPTGIPGYFELTDPTKARTIFACVVVRAFVSVFLILSFCELVTVKQNWSNGDLFGYFGVTEFIVACILAGLNRTTKLDRSPGVAKCLMFLNIWLFVQSLEAMIYGFAFWAQAHSKDGYGYNFMAWMDFIVLVSVKLYAGSGVLKLAFA
jgi:hypothetical protein